MTKKIPILIITLIGLLLRLFKLGYNDLWYDEAISIYITKIFFNFSVYSLLAHFDRPLFYSILYSWIKLFGQSEFSIRFPALVFSTLTIPSIYILGKKMFNSKVGIVASAIIALSPFQIWYAQEARHYSTVLLFGTVSTYFLVMVIKGSSKYWFYFIISSILALYSGDFYLPLLICQLVMFIVYRLSTSAKNNIKGFLSSLFFASICFLPAFKIYTLKFNYATKGFWIPKPDLHSLIITFENFLLGYNLSRIYYFAADILVLFLLFVSFKTIHNSKGARIGLYICLFLLLAPIASIYIFSKFFASIYLDRGLMVFSPYYYILLAAAITYLKRRKIRIFLCIAFCFLFIAGIASFYRGHMPMPVKHHLGTFIKKPVKPLIEFIGQNLKPGDIVGFANHSTKPLFEFYANRPKKYYEFFDPELPDTDTNRLIKENIYRIPKQKIPHLKAKRIWVIASNFSHDGGLDEQSEAVKKYLDKEMKLKISKNIDGKWVYLYEYREN